MLGLIGKKIGMTQIFGENGALVPVTVVHAGPCTVVQRKTKQSDGYDAVQLGFGKTKPARLSKAQRLHFEKKGVAACAHLREFRTPNAEKFEVGQLLTVATFKQGDTIDAIGVTKGRGFQGVIKRHGKHGGPASHGSDFHRRTGSIGMRTWPGRVFKNTRLPGHMGVDRVTVQNLEVVGVRPDDDVVLIKGALPGARGGLVVLVNKTEGFENRAELKPVKSESKQDEGKKQGEEKKQEQSEQS